MRFQLRLRPGKKNRHQQSKKTQLFTASPETMLMRFSVWLVILGWHGTLTTAHAAINDGKNGPNGCDNGSDIDCLPQGESPMGGGDDVIEIFGDASCPISTIWNGHTCVWDEPHEPNI